MRDDRYFWPPVVRLLFWGCPPAILRAVVSIHIDAINRVLRRWGSAQVGKEALVTGSPSIAHNDPAAAVDAKRLVADYVAPGFHFEPSAIFLRCEVPFAVSSLARSALLFSQAATALRIAAFQRSSVSDDSFPTFTHAIPSQESSALAVTCLAGNQQACESLPGEINLFHRGTLYGI